MQDFLLNTDFSMLQIPSDNLIPQTTGVFMSRTIKMNFNVEGKAFELGYLNYEVDRSVRNSIVHCYYLSIDTRLSQFIQFLVTISPEQERQSKVSNIRQVMLKVTRTPTQLFYNLIIKGEKTGIMKFEPSDFKTSEEESNYSDLEPLINSIINDEEEFAGVYNTLTFHLTSALHSFEVNYTDYDYFKNRRNHMYDLVVDSASIELLEFLRSHYSSLNRISSDVDEMYVRVSEKKKIATLVIYGTNDSHYEQIDFVPARLEDSDLSNTLPKFSLPFNEPIPKSRPIVKVKSEDLLLGEKSTNTELNIISICREIVNASDKASEKIKQLRDLLNQ